MKNKELIALIHRAIGDRSQAEFAMKADISPAQFSRILTGVNQPTTRTLRKIAGQAAGGVTLSMLLNAAGREDTEDKKDPADPAERAKASVDDFLDGVKTFTKQKAMLPTVLDFLDMVDTLYGRETYTYDVSDFSPYNYKTAVKDGIAPYPSAEKTCIVNVSFADEDMSATFEFALFVSQTEGGKLFFVGYEPKLVPLMKLGSPLAREVYEMLDGDPESADPKDVEEVFTVKSKKYEEEARSRQLHEDLKNHPEYAQHIFHSIFDDKEEGIIGAVDGEGFYTDGIDEVSAETFLRMHRDALMKDQDAKERIERAEKEELSYVEAMNAPKLKDSYMGSKKLREKSSLFVGTHAGLMAAIAEIIFEETGLRMTYHDNDDFPQNRPCLIFETDYPWNYSEMERGMSADTLSSIIDKYAKELETKHESIIIAMKF